MTTAAQVVSVARSQLGYKEGRNNDTKYGRWYGLNHNPWCAMFVSWVAAKAGATKIIPKHAYTPAGAQWFKNRGQWYSKPRVGDIVYFDFPNDGVGRISHVGIVESVLSDGSIITIEGNTNGAGSREGDGVYRKKRKVGIKGYGRPKYTTGLKSNATIVKEVIAGKWGSGDERIRRLRAAGYNPTTIQALVNKALS
jgi:hypothetical protein